MKASIAGRIRNTNLPKTKALLPLFEAVMNAFQAIEEVGGSDHKISISAERKGDLADEKQGEIDAFTVIDTGIGFSDANYESFQTVDSSYKASRGGKGLGRFLWLKAFQHVEIESVYRTPDGGGLLRRKFTFNITDDEKPCAATPSDLARPQTAIRLSGYRSPYVDECPRQLDIIAQRLIGHFLPLFLNPHAPAIVLSDASGKIDLHAFFRDNFQKLASEHPFTVSGQAFTLSGFRLRGALADHHELVYAAHYREVIAERLSKFLPNLRNKLHDSENGNFYYLAFVQGDYLNQTVNNERTDFSISKESTPQNGTGETGDEAVDGDDLFGEDICQATG